MEGTQIGGIMLYRRVCLQGLLLVGCLIQLACSDSSLSTIPDTNADGDTEETSEDGDGEGDGPTDLDGDSDAGDDFTDGDGPDEEQNDASDGDDPDGDELDGDEDSEQPPLLNSADFLILTEDSLLESAHEYATFRESLGSWTEVRTASSLQQGSNLGAFALNVQAWAREARENLDPRLPLFLLILGDAPEESDSIQGRIPALYCSNMEGDCYTDNKYADLDDDGLPDLALGRLPLRSAAEVTEYIRHAREHETQTPPGIWNRRLALYTGAANFSPEIDAMLEFLVFYALTKVSYDFDIFGVYNNSNSDYYYTPYEDKVMDLLNAGNLMDIYIGHGSSDSTDGLSLYNLDQFSSDHRFPFAFFFACLNGTYRGEDDSLAEAVLRLPRGAIASVASSDISHPYGNAVLSYEVQRVSLNLRLETIGEVVQEMKRAAITNVDDNLRVVIDSSAAIELNESLYEPLLLEHLNLYNLLGDPALTMHYPDGQVSFDEDRLPDTMQPGTLTVSGSVDLFSEGTVTVSLECSRNAMLYETEPGYDRQTIQENWAKANDKVVDSIEVSLVDGRFEAQLQIPADLPRVAYYVKAFAVGQGHDATGNMKMPAQ